MWDVLATFGKQCSTKPGGTDEWSYRYRATDVLISLCGPLPLLWELTPHLEGIDYEVSVLHCTLLTPSQVLYVTYRYSSGKTDKELTISYYIKDY